MNGAETVTGATRPAAKLRAGVDGLLSFAPSPLSDIELVDLLDAVETERRRLQAVDARLIAEIDARGLSRAWGRTSTTDLVSVRCRVAPGAARSRVDRARDLLPRQQPSGGVSEPVLPAFAAALAAGEISGEHADVVIEAVRRIDRLDDAAELFPIAEAFLLEAARNEDPRQLRVTATQLRAVLDPDGIEPDDDAAYRRRCFTLVPVGDGTAIAKGRLTAEAYAAIQTVLDSLSRPQPATDPGSDEAAGEPDRRTPTQRRHDGLVEMAMRLLRSGTLPESGGTPVTIIIRAEAHDLDLERLLHRSVHLPVACDEPQPHQPRGTVVTDHGQVMSMATLLRLADQAEVAVAALSATGAVLRYSRTRREASKSQRRALTARDGGCCFPGCTRPAAWTEAHHVVPWIDGGPTDVDNLCLVCSYHHRLIDRGDWQVVMIDGHPEWIPPGWLDPDRRPRRNRAHHPPFITFSPAAG